LIRNFFKISKSESVKSHLFYYDGKSEVSKQFLETALDFYIHLESDPEAKNGEEIFSKRCRTYTAEIEMARAAIRKYGEQIEPKTLESMQAKFYEITHSLKYRQSTIHLSVTYSLLNLIWDGIGPWQA
jgi:hypothetical protein